jgi:hypothetical protein
MNNNPDALKLIAANRIRYSVKSGNNVIIRNDTANIKLSELLSRRKQSYEQWLIEWGINDLTAADVSQESFNANIEYDIPDAVSVWSPYLLSWYRADTIETSGLNVLTFYDKTGNGRNLSNYASSTPKYIASDPIYNGQPSINFLDLQCSMSGTVWNLGNQDGIGYTYFFVYSPFDWLHGGGQTVYDFSVDKTTVRQCASFYREGGLAVTIDGNVAYNFPGTIPFKSFWPQENVSTCLTVADNTGSWRRSSVWITGTLVINDSNTLSSSRPNYLGIGSNFTTFFGNPVYPFSGSFAEIIICSGTLPMSGVNAIHNYIGRRYNIPSMIM